MIDSISNAELVSQLRHFRTVTTYTESLATSGLAKMHFEEPLHDEITKPNSRNIRHETTSVQAPVSD